MGWSGGAVGAVVHVGDVDWTEFVWCLGLFVWRVEHLLYPPNGGVSRVERWWGLKWVEWVRGLGWWEMWWAGCVRGRVVKGCEGDRLGAYAGGGVWADLRDGVVRSLVLGSNGDAWLVSSEFWTLGEVGGARFGGASRTDRCHGGEEVPVRVRQGSGARFLGCCDFGGVSCGVEVVCPCLEGVGGGVFGLAVVGRV
jgi:hypothetical protein